MRGKNRNLVIDYNLLDNLIMNGYSVDDCSEELKIPTTTLLDAIKRDKGKGITWNHYKNKVWRHNKADLVEVALTQAKKGNVAILIFCLKNLCKWSDKPALDDVRMENLDEDELTVIIKKAIQFMRSKNPNFVVPT
jgi:hypothetical protein